MSCKVRCSQTQDPSAHAVCGPALVAVNVVTSQGTDVDYLLHKRNVKHLRQALSNLSLAAFWFSGDHLDVSGPIFIIDNHLRDRGEKGYTDGECAVLQQARIVLDGALQDSIWSDLMHQRSLPAVGEVDEADVLDAWVPKTLARRTGASPTLPVEQALKFCQAVRRLQDEQSADLQNSWRGRLQAAGFAANRSLDQELAAKRTYQNRGHPSASGVGDAQLSRQTSQTLAESAKRSHSKSATLSALSPPQKHSIPPSPQLTEGNEIGLPDMTLSFTTLSAKANWILTQVLGSGDDTFVIFSQDVAILGYLTEVSGMIEVRACPC